MNLNIPDSLQAALAEKPAKELPIHDVHDIERAYQEGKPVVVRSLASMKFMLWGLIISLPFFNLIVFVQKKVIFTPDQTLWFFIFVNALAIGLFLPIHVFLNRDLKKNVFVVSREGIYTRFRPSAKRLTKSPGPKPRYKDMEALLDHDFLVTFSWLEKYFRWSEVAEVREELTAPQPYGKRTVYRWPIFPITDATSQAAEIREKIASKLVARLNGKDTRWEFSIILKGGGSPISLYLENFTKKGMKDVESLFLLSYLVNYYWRSSKEQEK